MSKPKRVSEVGVSEATVFFLTKERVGLVSGEAVYWIDLDDRRDLHGIMGREGELAWVYFAKLNNQVVSILRHSGEALADLPKIDSVEI